MASFGPREQHENNFVRAVEDTVDAWPTVQVSLNRTNLVNLQNGWIFCSAAEQGQVAIVATAAVANSRKPL